MRSSSDGEVFVGGRASETTPIWLGPLPVGRHELVARYRSSARNAAPSSSRPNASPDQHGHEPMRNYWRNHARVGGNGPSPRARRTIDGVRDLAYMSASYEEASPPCLSCRGRGPGSAEKYRPCVCSVSTGHRTRWSRSSVSSTAPAAESDEKGFAEARAHVPRGAVPSASRRGESLYATAKETSRWRDRGVRGRLPSWCSHVTPKSVRRRSVTGDLKMLAEGSATWRSTACARAAGRGESGRCGGGATTAEKPVAIHGQAEDPHLRCDR